MLSASFCAFGSFSRNSVRFHSCRSPQLTSLTIQTVLNESKYLGSYEALHERFSHGLQDGELGNDFVVLTGATAEVHQCAPPLYERRRLCVAEVP
jgi:hypothetical protein